MGSSDVVDPDGVSWSVRRRWYPWRRALSLRDLWSSTPVGKKAASPDSAEAEADAAAEAEESSLPGNVVLKVFFVTLAAIVWVVYGVGKLLFYTAVVVLFLVGSLIELVLELLVMPITLLLRLIGQSRWPVEINRSGERFGTRHAEDYAAAGDARDGLLRDIARGALPADQQATAV